MEQLDQSVTLWLNGLHCPFTDSMWLFFSDRSVWIPLYLLVAVLMVWRLGWKRGLAYVLLTALAILCVDQFANIIKNKVARTRPCNDAYMCSRVHRLLEGRSRSYSFFSAHAANAVAFALCSAHALRRGMKRTPARIYSWLIGLWAAMVGFSRVFVGKHYLGDVLVGFAAGAIISLILLTLFASCAAKATRSAA